jgi:HEAT repeat protein
VSGNSIRLALLCAAVFVSGCIQAEAPRPEASPEGNAATTPERRSAVEPHPVERRPQVPELETAMREDPSPDQRREAVYALADADGPDRAAILGQALTDPDARVRVAAVEAMTGIEDGTAADWLSIGLGDPEPRVRRAAVEALGQVGGASAGLLLQQALEDADAGVREAAKQMLEEPAFADAAVR